MMPVIAGKITENTSFTDVADSVLTLTPHTLLYDGTRFSLNVLHEMPVNSPPCFKC